MEQGSKEWLIWRNKGIGSSDIATILGVNPYKSIKKLWREKTGIDIPEDISKKMPVIRGNRLEPIARELFNRNENSQFIPALFEDKEHPFMRYSSDGADFDKQEIIEIKCMGEKNHNKVITTNQVLDYYIPQCQWGMMISEAKICHFIAYNPDFPNPIHSIKVYPNIVMFKLMREKALWFQKCVEEKREPV